MSVNIIPFILICSIGGGATAAGYVAFITLLGVFEKISEKFKSNKHGKQIEILIMIGVTLGNLIYIFQFQILSGVIPFIIFSFIGGIFTGCLAGALAETVDLFPILSRRLAIRDYLPYVLISASLGKAFGSIIQFFLF